MSEITGLQRISNAYASDIKFTNTESKGNNRTIKSNTSVNVGNAWIPWCDEKKDFKDHHMEIQANDFTYYIWQSGDSIRATKDGWKDNAPSIGGDSSTSQSVYWTLDSDGTLTQFAEK